MTQKTVSEFIQRKTKRNMIAVATVRNVYDTYLRWCIVNSVIPEAAIVFNKAMRSAGYVRTQGYVEGKNTKIWKGLEMQ